MQPCLVSGFSGIASSFFPFTLILATGLLCISFIMCRYGPWIPVLSNPLTRKDAEFYEMLFQLLLKWTCDFFFEFVYFVDYIDGFSYSEPSLHPQDETYLIMVNDNFDVFLISVGKNFIEYFFINIHKGNKSKVLFLSWIFVWFWYQQNCGFEEWVGQCSFCFYFVV